MGYHFFPGRLFMGILMMCMSAVMYLARNKRRPEGPFTRKQYLWACLIVFMAGAFVTIMAFGPE